jgi:hypothetical protein
MTASLAQKALIDAEYCREMSMLTITLRPWGDPGGNEPRADGPIHPYPAPAEPSAFVNGRRCRCKET